MSVIAEITAGAVYDGVAVAMMTNGASMKEIERHVEALMRIEGMIAETLAEADGPETRRDH